MARTFREDLFRGTISVYGFELLSEYRNQKELHRFRCSEGHEFVSRRSHFYNYKERFCPYCRKRHKNPGHKHTVIRRTISLWQRGFTYYKPDEFECSVCGSAVEKTFGNAVNHYQSCPVCKEVGDDHNRIGLIIDPAPYDHCLAIIGPVPPYFLDFEYLVVGEPRSRSKAVKALPAVLKEAKDADGNPLYPLNVQAWNPHFSDWFEDTPLYDFEPDDRSPLWKMQKAVVTETESV